MWLVWGRKNAYTLLVRKREGKRPLGRTRRRRENNIKMDKVRWCGMDLSGSGCGQVEALVNMVMNIRVSV